MARCVHGVDLEEPCLKCALTEPVAIGATVVAAESLSPGTVSFVSASESDFDRGVATERARVRSIVLKFYGNDWNGTKCLEEIDDG